MTSTYFAERCDVCDGELRADALASVRSDANAIVRTRNIRHVTRTGIALFATEREAHIEAKHAGWYVDAKVSVCPSCIEAPGDTHA